MGKKPLYILGGGAAVPEETDVAQISPGLARVEKGAVGDPAGIEQLTASLTLR